MGPRVLINGIWYKPIYLVTIIYVVGALVALIGLSQTAPAMASATR